MNDRDRPAWKPVSRVALGAWIALYALFLLYAAMSAEPFLLVDNVNLVTHEAGHFFFGWFGYTIGILGGSLFQLLVPLLIGIYFFRQRETVAVGFCAFWFFENFLYIGTYMSDARSVSLPLVGSGDHDWEILFTQWNLLLYDRAIGGWTRALGWVGMPGSVAWLLFKGLAAQRSAGSGNGDS